MGAFLSKSNPIKINNKLIKEKTTKNVIDRDHETIFLIN